MMTGLDWWWFLLSVFAAWQLWRLSNAAVAIANVVVAEAYQRRRAMGGML